MISTAITTVILAAFVVMLFCASYLWDERERLEGQLDEIEFYVSERRKNHPVVEWQGAMQIVECKIKQVRRG